MAGDVCDVCGVGGREVVGVASIPGVPMSVAWCRSCLERPLAVPPYVAEHWLDEVDPDSDEGGVLGGLAEWVSAAEIWVPHGDAAGAYEGIVRYAGRAEVKERIREQRESWNREMEAGDPGRHGDQPAAGA